IVMIVGPTKPFLVEESAAMARYVERGGHLFVALDPDNGLDYKDLLAPLGLTYTPVTLANDQLFARRFYKASDHINLVSASVSSHPSVATLSHLGSRGAVILPGAGALAEMKDKPKNVTVDFTVHANNQTWDDKNGNFAFDPPAETRKGWELAAAVTRKK